MIALDSNTAQELFVNSTLKDRFRFIRDHLSLAFKIESQIDANNSPEPFNDGQINSNRGQLRKTLVATSGMSTNDKVALRHQVRVRLSNSPYSSAYLFQEFAMRSDTYKEVTEAGAP